MKKKHRQKPERVNLIISVLLILSVGAVSGYAMGFYRATVNQFPAIEFVPEINEKVATIHLLDSGGGKLKGEVVGRNARIVYNRESFLELEPDTPFTIPLDQIYLKDFYQTRDVPDGAMFVASKKGKYYYSVFDKRGYNLSPDNRVYFEAEYAAEERGFIKKE